MRKDRELALLNSYDMPATFMIPFQSHNLTAWSELSPCHRVMK